jgi:hypothetical protein
MKKMKLRRMFNYPLLLILVSVFSTSCKKNNTPAPAGTSNFWHGNILGSPSTFIGPGNAILLRNDGTMREYANDYYSAGTTMTASDTATANFKIDGTYTTTTSGSTTTVIATWIQAAGSPVLTYTLTGTIAGNSMTGHVVDAGTGIGTDAQFSFTTP